MTICAFTTSTVSRTRRRGREDSVTITVVHRGGVPVVVTMLVPDATKLYDALAGVLGLLDSDGCGGTLPDVGAR